MIRPTTRRPPMSPTVREHPRPVRHAPFGDQEASHPRKQKRPDIIQAFSTLFARNKSCSAQIKSKTSLQPRRGLHRHLTQR
uniref:Uncharacterized protein n=1 Tax=Thauera sp. B4 TaxID=503999 RepID=B4Y368_9RHOO|nr:hypothetical protein [Thauera sp. B4]